jgi:hypothetical protein
MPQRNWLIIGVSSGFGRITTEQFLGAGATASPGPCATFRS